LAFSIFNGIATESPDCEHWTERLGTLAVGRLDRKAIRIREELAGGISNSRGVTSKAGQFVAMTTESEIEKEWFLNFITFSDCLLGKAVKSGSSSGEGTEWPVIGTAIEVLPSKIKDPLKRDID
jgi:hypothetical protein